MRGRCIWLPVFLLCALVPAAARAEVTAGAGAGTRIADAPVDDAIGFALPQLIAEEPAAAGEPGRRGELEELDVANIAYTAVRGVVAVQEAPAIVTVVTEDRLQKAGVRNLEMALDRVPGWLRYGATYNQFPFGLTRGTLQAMLYMQDGLSLFDSVSNVPSVGSVAPELIKRMEVVTGPGGVLWGANSYMGIVNVITRDAEDVDGVEAGMTAGHGNGLREYSRVYALGGDRDVAGTGLAAFVHASYERHRGAAYELPNLIYSVTAPQPNSLAVYGPLTTVEPPYSYLLHLDGKLSFGNWKLHLSAPFGAQQRPISFNGWAVRETLPEDDLRGPDGAPLCAGDGMSLYDDTCADKGRVARANRIDIYERYALLEHQSRGGARVSVRSRAYAVQLVRNFEHLGLLGAYPGFLPGGLAVSMDFTNYRAGGSSDVELRLGERASLFAGVEAFHEWFASDDRGSRQGEGVQSVLLGPYQLERVPLLCPRQPDGSGGVEFVPQCPLTAIFAGDRTVLGAYANPRWRVAGDLTLDGGARVQAAPDALGTQGYSPELLLSGSVVYRLGGEWYSKLNYSEGFRPPVFNNTNSNGRSIQIDGARDLATERSRAVQVELNTRVFRDSERLRELYLRSDYSYTRLDNLVQVFSGRYENSGARGIHSAELLASLRPLGGHSIELGYTWLRIDAEDRGRHLSMPENWFHLGAILQLHERVALAGNLRVLGAMEDPNRLVEYRDLVYDETGRSVDRMSGSERPLVVEPHELVLDRLPPSADLTLALSWQISDAVRWDARVYNALNGRNYQPDAIYDFEPQFGVPNPAEDFHFTIGLTYAR